MSNKCPYTQECVLSPLACLAKPSSSPPTTSHFALYALLNTKSHILPGTIHVSCHHAFANAVSLSQMLFLHNLLGELLFTHQNPNETESFGKRLRPSPTPRPKGIHQFLSSPFSVSCTCLHVCSHHSIWGCPLGWLVGCWLVGGWVCLPYLFPSPE